MEKHDRTDIDGVASEITGLALEYVDAWTRGGQDKQDEHMDSAAISRATSSLLASAFAEIKELRDQVGFLVRRLQAVEDVNRDALVDQAVDSLAVHKPESEGQ